MSKQGTENTSGDKGDVALTKDTPRSLALSEAGIKTGNDFANLMSALMSDIISGRISPGIANATCNAGGKLLKIVEMQYKYGGSKNQDEKVLVLAASAQS
jgi:hypothetical protein